MKKQLFGTDGIRGRANTYPVTGEMAFLLGRAVAHHFETTITHGVRPKVIIGKDTRLSCYMLEQALGAGICAQGGEAILTGPLPTPGVAFATKNMRANAGIVISASHNPYHDNGIKIFDAEGFKLSDEVELKLEALLLNPGELPAKSGLDLGRAQRLREVFGRYIVHCKSAFSGRFDMNGLKIVLDCANGAGYEVAPMMLRELGAEVIGLGVHPNGQNINLECGSLHPHGAAERVRAENADLGICLDGDADRVVAIGQGGEVIPGDQLIGLFARLLLDEGILAKGDTVVGSVMSNLGLELYLQQLGLNFERTPVGDRYIVESMRQRLLPLGGEPSGHIIFGHYATTGDGALAALKVVEAMRTYQRPLNELAARVALFPQLIKSLAVERKPPLAEVPPVQKALAAVEQRLGGRGRVVLRYSGTEPKVRVMVEGEDEGEVRRSCDELAEVLDRELNRA